jgi:demethoxyubiquinone hydroxylase (CLK1/Coq7/Cat5 family)
MPVLPATMIRPQPRASLQHAIQAAHHHHRQHDQPVLRRAVRPAQPVATSQILPAISLAISQQVD